MGACANIYNTNYTRASEREREGEKRAREREEEEGKFNGKCVFYVPFTDNSQRVSRREREKGEILQKSKDYVQ
jgi:hypothetical protein